MNFSKAKGLRHVVTAADVTATTIVFANADMPPSGFIIVVRTAAGAVKAWDGVVTIGDGKVTVDNAGATDWAATDTIDLVLF